MADTNTGWELGTAALRVLAHPLRIHVLTLLRQRGPSTATRVAEELGINPGAASYHLRRLAAGGLIAEEPGRGSGRERWWKAVHQQSIHDPASRTPSCHAPSPMASEQREAGRGYVHAVALAAADRLRAAAQEVPLLPEEWFEVGTFGDFVLRLSPQGVADIRDEIFAVVARYREAEGGDAERGEDVDGLTPVTVQVQAFPVPGTVALQSAESAAIVRSDGADSS
ncbi:ArsR/SmtB family transcription factor [Actinomycetota bacterium Odt1-20B]